ncbi:polysaccharide biosynthesis/export family protein [Gaoshiqia sediminis]|uniref:Polysaccharide export protein n=1 Tax=Gaoshiqia sediminis TaxID=2986998 RepID=A0AA41Y1C8_9BACT|nr:polysaccharide biosynthesis/export family protein [Gaoshiqia sediminis]MCW0481656.1 polysaccharide export protein [Gaoshiqia sediminis]
MNTTSRIRRNSFIRIFWLSIISCSFLFLSCVTQRDVEYLQDSNIGIQAFNEAKLEDYKLKPNDELYIQVSSLDDINSNIFSSTNVQQVMSIGSIQPYGASLISYAVDNEGFLHLPVIGPISVVDKTTAQVGEMITKSLSKILSEPRVSVKLVNRFVTVLGEVQRPGHYPYSQVKVSIYDAIGLAGDITEFGNRREVILVRNVNGQNIRVPLDLTQSALLGSEYFYASPNDVIYVKPMRKKFWGLRQFPYDVLLSTITATILFYSVVK